MRLLIIAGGGMLLTPEHIKERKKRRQWVHPWIRKRDSKGANYFIINDLRLMDKEDFRKYRFLKQNNLFHKIMFPLFLYCTSGHCSSKCSLQLMLASVVTSWNSLNKKTCSA